MIDHTCCSATYECTDDGCSCFVIKLDVIATKCFKELCGNPKDYIENYINSRVKLEKDRIIQEVTDKLITENRLQDMKSIEETILTYERPPDITNQYYDAYAMGGPM